MRLLSRNGSTLGANRMTIPSTVTADWVQNGSVYYKVVDALPVAPMAVGGWETDIDVDGTIYRVHQFLQSDDIVFSRAGDIEVLVVGGGGSGARCGDGWGGGGGGGGGGIQYNASFAVTATTYNITIGAGGVAPAAGVNSAGNPGGNTIFSTLTAGGGLGGIRWNNPSGTGGASGSPQSKAGGAQSGDQGGGGGGAGAVGSDAVQSGSHGGAGGIGILYDITGVALYYGTGGGGGGGAGSDATTNDVVDCSRQYNVFSPTNTSYTSPRRNSGNGGCGAYAQYGACSGAAGIVVIRYVL